MRKAAKDLAKLDHDRPLGSEVGHHLVEDRLESSARWLRQVRVNRRRCNVNVAEQDLDHSYIDAVFQQPRRIAVAKDAWCDPSGDPCRKGRLSTDALKHLAVNRLETRAVRKHPAMVAMARPELAQIIANWCGKRNQPLLVTLPDDAHQQASTVDVFDLKGYGLADAQTAGIDEGEAGFVGRVLDMRQERSDLSIRENVGQTPLFRWADSFFENSAQGRPSVRQ